MMLDLTYDTSQACLFRPVGYMAIEGTYKLDCNTFDIICHDAYATYLADTYGQTSDNIWYITSQTVWHDVGQFTLYHNIHSAFVMTYI